VGLASQTTRAKHRAAPRQGGDGDGASTHIIPAVKDVPPEPEVTPAAAPVKSRVAFIDIGRAIAAVLVVYAHFDLLFLRQNYGISTGITDLIDNGLGVPLALSDQSIGAVAVPFFFLVSGFVVTPIALKLGGPRFGTNRFFRVYPPVIVAVLVAAGAYWIGMRPLTTGHPARTMGELFANLSLVNFIQQPTNAFVGVAWTLTVEVMFYVLLVAMIPVLKRLPWLALFAELDLVLVLLCTHGLGGPNYHAFVANVVYLTTPIMGQVLWAAWTRRIPPWLAGLYLLGAWALFVWAGSLAIDQDYLPRATPVGYALLLFLLGLFAEKHLKQRRVWTELSERSYSIYLLHGVLAFPVMHLVVKSVPIWLTILLGLVVLAVGVELNFRLVERPSHNLGRMLARKLGEARARPRPEPEPEPEPEDDEDDEDADDWDDEDEPDDGFTDDPPTSPVREDPPPRRPARPPVTREPVAREPRDPVNREPGPREPGSQPVRAPRPPARTPVNGVGKPLNSTKPAQNPPATAERRPATWTPPERVAESTFQEPGSPRRSATPGRAEASVERTDLIPKVSRDGMARQRIE